MPKRSARMLPLGGRAPQSDLWYDARREQPAIMARLETRRSSTRKARRLGQVDTPRPVADWMARWACAHRPRRMLDPAVGGGVFVDAVETLAGRRRAGVVPAFEVCEIDPGVLRRFAGVPRRLPIRLREEDFIAARFAEPFDAVLANPPYIRHHDLRCPGGVFAAFDRLCRRRISRMTNLYGLFLAKIWTLLARGGRAAVITPAEWLNADFGVALKTYLLEENAIDAIVHFDHAANVFEGALTTAAITLLRRGRRAGEPIRFCHAAGVDDLSAATLEGGRRVLQQDLAPTAKWTPLFQNRAWSAPGGPTLGDIARCTRGIATGANDYFTLRESDRRRWGIDFRDLRLCITKAQHVAGDRLTRPDVQRLRDADQRVYLLSPRPRLTAAVGRYLEEGRRLGIDRRYLPSHRPVWYAPERRDPAPILVSVFARGDFRFVLNEAGVLNLTAYHAIYPRNPNDEPVGALFRYLNSAKAKQALVAHRRIYGDGLLKVEPRDVEALPIPEAVRRACAGQI